MGRTRLPVYSEYDEAGATLARRIATGLRKVGLAMKQQSWLQANEEGLSATQGQILAGLMSHGALTGTEPSDRRRAYPPPPRGTRARTAHERRALDLAE